MFKKILLMMVMVFKQSIYFPQSELLFVVLRLHYISANFPASFYLLHMEWPSFSTQPV